MAAIRELERQIAECRTMIVEMQDTLKTYLAQSDSEYEYESEATESDLSVHSAPATVSHDIVSVA